MSKNGLVICLVGLIFVSACLPVGEFALGIENTPIVVTQLPEPTEVDDQLDVESEPSDAATSEPNEIELAYGTVTGRVCFPSEYVPAMDIYFRNTANGKQVSISQGENVFSYSTELPVGNYIAFAYPSGAQGGLGGLYSNAVACGLTVECNDHDPLPFDIVESQTAENIDLCDWYANPSQVPLNPLASEPVNPAFAGLIYQDLSTGGVWKVGEDGLAKPLLDQWTAEFSPDGRMALFVQDRDIWLADLENGSWKNITNTPDRWEGLLRWVPGIPGMISFLSGSIEDEFSSGDLSVYNLEDQTYRILTERISNTGNSFSPDGRQVAYSVSEEPWIMNIETGEKTRFNPADYGIQAVRDIVAPSWSPNGDRLAWWVRGDFEVPDQTALAIFDLDAGTAQLLHLHQPSGGHWNPSPTWSPDGQWLTSHVLGDGSKGSLWVFKSDGSEEHELGNAGDFAWSLNSNAIAYIVWTGAAQESSPALAVVGEWIPQPMNMKPGSIPILFVQN